MSDDRYELAAEIYCRLIAAKYASNSTNVVENAMKAMASTSIAAARVFLAAAEEDSQRL
jgi:hypothetical protein